MRLGEIIRDHLGWCPHSPARRSPPVLPEGETSRSRQSTPHSPRVEKIGNLEKFPVPGWFVSVSVIVLFGTLFFGGSIYWPVLVLAILIAGLMYWYITVVRRGA